MSRRCWSLPGTPGIDDDRAPSFAPFRSVALLGLAVAAVAVASWKLWGSEPASALSAAPNGSPARPAEPQRVRIAVGTQDTTISCAAGGPLVRELHLLEKYLPHDGKYRNVTYDIQWESQPTGGQLNTKFLNNQLDIVQMAEFPAVIGATAFLDAGSEVRSLYIGALGRHLGRWQRYPRPCRIEGAIALGAQGQDHFGRLRLNGPRHVAESPRGARSGP